ncbi:MAG TPA: cytochrome c [Candidatus Acidoferrales bacterium]|nr:cytochrome c [Candidatus Acidoferrales bacterium]
MERKFSTLLALLILGLGSTPLACAQESNRTRLVYAVLCADCHGRDGKGDGPQANTLAAKPRAFQDCDAMNRISFDVLFRAIKYGGAAVAMSDEMPGWAAGMNDREIRDLVEYIRGFCRNTVAMGSPEPLPAHWRTVEY